MFHALCFMKVLGIDPGTATTGWAVLEESRGCLTPLAYGVVNTSSKNPAPERIAEISSDLEKIIKKYKPKEAAVEDIFFFKNLKTAVKVSESRGAVLLTLQNQKVKIFSYTPLQIKQALTGYGRAEKKQIQIMVKNILKLKSVPKSDDAADALAIAVCHINSRKLISLNK
jgi:crossover junction endodeoxyribonuclease RuvC